MRKSSYQIPSVDFREDEIERNPSGFVRRLLDVLENLRLSLVNTINFNAVTEVSQNDQPTPEVGAMMIWEDADATSTNPTHYLVYNMGGTVVTFASVQVVP